MLSFKSVSPIPCRQTSAFSEIPLQELDDECSKFFYISAITVLLFYESTCRRCAVNPRYLCQLTGDIPYHEISLANLCTRVVRGGQHLPKFLGEPALQNELNAKPSNHTSPGCRFLSSTPVPFSPAEFEFPVEFALHPYRTYFAIFNLLSLDPTLTCLDSRVIDSAAQPPLRRSIAS